MGLIADQLRATISEMKRQDDELQEKLNRVVKTANKLVKETDTLLTILEGE